MALSLTARGLSSSTFNSWFTSSTLLFLGSGFACLGALIPMQGSCLMTSRFSKNWQKLRMADSLAAIDLADNPRCLNLAIHAFK